jgi:ATP-dependent Lhr-like helicase
MFRELELASRIVIQEEKDIHLFLWRGSQTTAVFGATTATVGLPAQVHDLGLTLD